MAATPDFFVDLQKIMTIYQFFDLCEARYSMKLEFNRFNIVISF